MFDRRSGKRFYISFQSARESRQETYVGASKKVGDEKSIAVSSVGERKVHLFEKIIIDPAYMEKCGIVYSYGTLSREILTTKVIPTRNKHFHMFIIDVSTIFSMRLSMT